MSESIKDKVAIIGMGCTKFGELWDKDSYDLVIDCSYDAFKDAGVGPKDIQAAWVGTIMGSTATQLSAPLKLDYIPVTRVENVCATGMEALRAAAFALMAKAYDLVLAVGYEKLKDTGYGGLPMAVQASGSEKWHPVFGSGDSAPGRYAMAATRYFHQFGLSPEEGKRTLAKISVKSHYNGSLNPRAHLRMQVTEEQVMKAPMIAWPLGLFDACGVTDGGAAAVLCRTEDAKKFKPNGDFVTVKAFGLSTGPGMGKVRSDYDYTHWEETVRASKQAYKDAGITNPGKEIGMCEVHDCFSIAELVTYEDLGMCEKGKAKADIEAGELGLKGKHPFNVGGGLKSFGHPIGASGIREVFEGYQEILGIAQLPERQLKDVKFALGHNQGGNPGRFICSICIVGQP
jgi:acetyl-CoA C-acetyltransferase